MSFDSFFIINVLPWIILILCINGTITEDPNFLAHKKIYQCGTVDCHAYWLKKKEKKTMLMHANQKKFQDISSELNQKKTATYS